MFNIFYYNISKIIIEYMFARFIYDNHPIVFVDFSESLENDNDFDLFLSEWSELYNKQEDFEFIFDTRKVDNINFKYCIKMGLFIMNLKKREYQYLKNSLILINDQKIQRLLDFIFIFTKPVAPVYIWNTLEDKDFISEFDKIKLNCPENILLISP